MNLNVLIIPSNITLSFFINATINVFKSQSICDVETTFVRHCGQSYPKPR